MAVKSFSMTAPQGKGNMGVDPLKAVESQVGERMVVLDSVITHLFETRAYLETKLISVLRDDPGSAEASKAEPKCQYVPLADGLEGYVCRIIDFHQWMERLISRIEL